VSAAPRRVAILGSTGSIGRQALEVVDRHPELLQVAGLVAGTDRAGLADQAGRLGVTDRSGLGEEAAVELAAADDVDIVLNAIMGAAGLRASLAALSAGKTLALANKESLVAGGRLCLETARKGGGTIVAVDSEHAAIAQCLRGRDRAEVRRIILTASGGPFRTRADLRDVSPAEALAHPTWSMGRKITIDSATLMNKGLEVIEAHHLFAIELDRIDILVHPQSIVHGMVEMTDGSLVLNAGATDMRTAIQAALLDDPSYSVPFETLDLQAVKTLTFEDLDRARFPTVDLAYAAARSGGTHPAALNAANEVAVQAFLEGRIGFLDICSLVAEVLGAHESGNDLALDDILAADRWAREEAERSFERRALSVMGGRT
jgi:1-deoxy-D-xylulose-5-phosphate reductoisomerase